MKFYERIFNRRTENIGNITNFPEEQALANLLLISFYNSSSPGELPDEFAIFDIMLSKDSLKKLLEELGLNISSIDLLVGSYGNSFKVSLKI